jgi:hypothetical protein
MKKKREDDDLLQIGAEGKKGDKAFKQYAKLKDKESKVKRDKVIQKIEDAPKDRKTYSSFLANLLLERLKIVDWEIGWFYRVAPTEKGVVMEIESPDNRIFRSAFKTTADPIADLNAIDMFALRAENTVDAHRYKSDIWLPNQQKMN